MLWLMNPVTCLYDSSELGAFSSLTNQRPAFAHKFSLSVSFIDSQIDCLQHKAASHGFLCVFSPVCLTRKTPINKLHRTRCSFQRMMKKVAFITWILRLILTIVTIVLVISETQYLPNSYFGKGKHASKTKPCNHCAANHSATMIWCPMLFTNENIATC